jgi:hypothetical protein
MTRGWEVLFFLPHRIKQYFGRELSIAPCSLLLLLAEIRRSPSLLQRTVLQFALFQTLQWSYPCPRASDYLGLRSGTLDAEQFTIARPRVFVLAVFHSCPLQRCLMSLLPPVSISIGKALHPSLVLTSFFLLYFGIRINPCFVL